MTRQNPIISASAAPERRFIRSSLALVGTVFLVELLWFGCDARRGSGGIQSDGSGPRDADRASAQAEMPLLDADDHLSLGIIDSKHDFTQGGATGDLCLTCHTPHLPTTRPALLDRALGPARLQAAYQAGGIEFDGATLLCLGCHDGVIARDVYTSAHAATFVEGRRGSGLGSLTSHPVGTRYPLADATYHDIAAVTADGTIKLPAGRLQCTSCHDPHNTRRLPAMLVRSNERSRLCLSCHRL